MTKLPMTGRQAEVLHVIEEHFASKGAPPTLRYIGDVLGIRSTNAVNDHLRQLVLRGHITRKPNESRGIQLVTDCCPMCGSKRSS